MVKVLVVDFDDTLYMHGERIWSNRERTRRVVKGEDIYSRSVIPSYMRDLIARAVEQNIPIYCVSWVIDSLWVDAKQAKVDKDFGKDVIKVIGSSTPEHKLDILQSLVEKHGCERHELLFVDDLYSTWQEASINGFTGICPQYVEAFGVDRYLPDSKEVPTI